MSGHQTPFRYRCRDCNREYKRDEVTYLCPQCAFGNTSGMPLRGVLTVVFDYAYICSHLQNGNPDWRLFNAVEDTFFPPFPVGNTPFQHAKLLGDFVGLRRLWIKNDGLNPSGSLKDRASFLISAEARRCGLNSIVTASTGNAASAMAAVCAAAGQKAVVFAPAAAPRAKLLQILLYGADLMLVEGTYDEAFELSLQYTRHNKSLNRNTGYHPLTIEGKKTVAQEIFSQNNMKIPDVIVVPVGDGVIISGVYKGFYDMLQCGIIDRVPRLMAVQAKGSAAIHHYFKRGNYQSLVKSETIADSISVAAPSNAHMARDAILDSAGFSVIVEDDEILEAQQILARYSGIFAEPAAAASLAGLLKQEAKSNIGADDQVVLLITGHGLKDIDTPLRRLSAGQPKTMSEWMKDITDHA